ncbi:MAG TPA: hypothetical protein VFV99_11585 [Kofleriaceae bacterium]|nr:hypothetical protein [Kofleriaceae bacterium]
MVVWATACTDPIDPLAPRTFTFGPYPLEPGVEITDDCVSISLHNDEPIYVNQAELTTSAGFHHSNWFWVPETQFAGADGTWSCDERHYSEAAAGVFGAVVFAQSTQALHEIQAFPPGAATKIPPHAKLVAGLHLLNASDEPLAPKIELTITPIAADAVTADLHGFAFQNQTIQLPPHAKSRFTIECDLTKGLGLGGAETTRPPPDFRIYHVLAHYHELGSGLTFEALRDVDGGGETMFETQTRIGDALGSVLDPPFDLTGHSKIRFACEYDNPRDATVGWGVGDQEMCIVFAFTDSPLVWSGGAPYAESPGPGVDNNGVIEFTHACVTTSTDGTH